MGEGRTSTKLTGGRKKTPGPSRYDRLAREYALPRERPVVKGGRVGTLRGGWNWSWRTDKMRKKSLGSLTFKGGGERLRK